MESGSLFRVVNASSVEATVLGEAERRARARTIPSFVGADSLGFGTSSLGNFCSTVDSLVLGMAADAAREEGRRMRESGVANLAVRDRVQMKEQILRGLLRLRHGQEDDGVGAAGAIHAATVSSIDPVAVVRLNEEWNNREDLIKTGAVTPLDDIAGGPASGAATRGRMTLMDHKVAEGMTVRLPRSRRRHVRSRADVSDEVEASPLRDSGAAHGGLGTDSFRSPGNNTGASTSSVSAGGDADQGRTTLGWTCQACTLVCPEDAAECPACRKRRPRKRNSPARAIDLSGDGITQGTSAQGGSRSEADSNTANTVECPLCLQDVEVEDGARPDACLSKHMDGCTRRSGRTRSDRHTGDKGATVPGRRSSTESRKRGAAGSSKERTAGRRRRKSGSRSLMPPDSASATDTGVVGKVFGGGQPLVDDFDDGNFEARKAQREDAPLANGISENGAQCASSSDLGDGLTMEGGVAHRLFQFQLTGVRWMWQLHRQGAGGIVGDEMGLGKTVQVSAFLGALHGADVMRRVLVLCPATVLSHWMAELHTWAPLLRVVILHRCVEAFSAVSGSSGKLRALIRRVLGWPNVVVVTSYEGMKSLKALLLPCNWDYCILDEGQRIRNPDAAVTLVCKQIRTVHRLVLTGTPIQNNLRELWSLFDFVFPGRLGTLPAFEAEFADPIRVGGYSNASPMQARLAYRCALVLRDLIHPYLLRRQKKDLEDIIRLPAKTEQVLFCRLTSYQRRLYGEFLESAEVKSVLSRTMRAFRAIGILRKLCNHPDLACPVGDSVVTRIASQFAWGESKSESDEGDLADEAKTNEYGATQRSGKLLVLQQILPLWHQQGHRVLLFAQTRQMLNIIERFVDVMGWSYGRLDGSTPVGTRQTLVDRFNSDESIFVMLLTTRTGGVGINLTGADRVILFDPDWNPSTDMQARERSWRVGQRRQVTVYRLVTAGTIEEKIYHRQIFKTALTNRVLQDPKQRRIFSADELGNLFTLGDDGSLDGFTDTVDLFQGEGKIDVPGRGEPTSSSAHAERPSGGQGKRDRKQSRRAKRSPPPEKQGTDPSPLLATATVVLKSAAREDDGAGGAEGEASEKSKGDDSAVLQALYDGAPLSSVFQHDLAEGSGVISVEQKRMEEAAKRAAQRAVNQLRISRRTLRAGAGQGGFQSSWTGRNGGVSAENSSQAMRAGGTRTDGSQGGGGRRFGTVANPSFAGRQTASRNDAGSSVQQGSFFDRDGRESASDQGSSAGVSSQDILRQIRLRNGAPPAPSPGLFPEFQEPDNTDDKDAYYSSLLQRLQDYLTQARSGVDTAALVHAFGDVPPADVAVFRQMLQAIAVCTNGEWSLRDART